MFTESMAPMLICVVMFGCIIAGSLYSIVLFCAVLRGSLLYISSGLSAVKIKRRIIIIIIIIIISFPWCNDAFILRSWSLFSLNVIRMNYKNIKLTAAYNKYVHCLISHNNNYCCYRWFCIVVTAVQVVNCIMTYVC